MKNAGTLLLISMIGLILLFVITMSNTVNTPLDMPQVDDKPEGVTLRFTSAWGGSDERAAILQDLLSIFQEENPDIKVLDGSMFGEDFLFSLKTDFASGNEPDVFGLWPGSDRNQLIQTGKIAPLGSVIESGGQWSERFDPLVWEEVQAQTQIYSVPFEVIFEGLFINQSIFENHHIPIPRDFDSLVSACRRLRVAGVIPIAYNSTPEGSFIYQNMILQIGGRTAVEHPFGPDGQVHPALIEAMEQMKVLYDQGAFPDTAFVIDDITRNQLFLQGEAAMIVQGSWFLDELANSPVASEVTIIPFPAQEAENTGKTIVYGIGNGNFHISRAAWEDPKRREASIRLLKFLTGPQAVEYFQVQLGFAFSVEGEVVHMPSAQDLVAQSRVRVAPVDHFIDRGYWENTIVKHFPSVLEGSMEARDVFEAKEGGDQ